MAKQINIIAAIDSQNGLSKNGVIPWDLPNDRKYFKDHVKKGPVLMGWNTYKENKYRPYGNGQNYIATRSKEVKSNEKQIVDIDEFIANYSGELWVAGGGSIYTAVLRYADRLYLTRVDGDFNCDVYFPGFSIDFCLVEQSEIMTENGIKYKYEIWERLS